MNENEKILAYPADKIDALLKKIDDFNIDNQNADGTAIRKSLSFRGEDFSDGIPKILQNLNWGRVANIEQVAWRVDLAIIDSDSFRIANWHINLQKFEDNCFLSCFGYSVLNPLSLEEVLNLSNKELVYKILNSGNLNWINHNSLEPIINITKESDLSKLLITSGKFNIASNKINQSLNISCNVDEWPYWTQNINENKCTIKLDTKFTPIENIEDVSLGRYNLDEVNKMGPITMEFKYLLNMVTLTNIY